MNPLEISTNEFRRLTGRIDSDIDAIIPEVLSAAEELATLGSAR